MPNQPSDVTPPAPGPAGSANLTRRAALKRIAQNAGALLAAAIPLAAVPLDGAVDGSPRPRTRARNFRRDAYSDYSRYTKYADYQDYSNYGNYSKYGRYAEYRNYSDYRVYSRYMEW